MTSLIYLAQPFSHPDEIVRQTRFQAARHVAATLMGRGASVFSPIVHGVALEKLLTERDRTSHEFWMQQCISIMRHCDQMYVLPLVGWRESKGLAEEFILARLLQIPVKIIARTDCFLPPNPWGNLEPLTDAEIEANDYEVAYV